MTVPSSSPTFLLLGAHAFATLSMTGLIWFVQVVHYPLMGMVGPERFQAYSAAHQRLTTFVVGPLMLIEVATAIAIVLVRGTQVPIGAALTGLALLAAIWASTFFLQVPAHGRLLDGFDPDVHARLVGSNWIRTVLWTARGILAVWMIWFAMRPAA